MSIASVIDSRLASRPLAGPKLAEVPQEIEVPQAIFDTEGELSAQIVFRYSHTLSIHIFPMHKSTQEVTNCVSWIS